MPAIEPIDQVLDAARWAPSGDNTQVWRLESTGPDRAVLHGFDTRAHCVYDLDGFASQVSIGAFVETAAIAASTLGRRLAATLRPDGDEARPTLDLRLVPDPALAADPLAAVIRERSVQRRPYATTPLTADQTAALAASAGPAHEVRWLASADERLRLGRLLFHSARLRLITPEAYRVHSTVIDWGRRTSVDKVPDQALGVGAPVLAMMKFAMASWSRVQFFNRFLAGTWTPRLLMDLRPAWACGAHLLIQSRAVPRTAEDHLAAGRAMQRLWLTATSMGLVMQPEMTPLIFGRYARQGRRFSEVPGTQAAAERIGRGLDEIWGTDAIARGVFMARIGHGPRAQARSVRLELAQLRPGAAGPAHG